MAKVEELDIFNVSVDDVEFHEYHKKESVLYVPKSKDTKDGIYESLIRFLPNPLDPKKSLARKLTYYLKDAEGNGKTYDSPSTIQGQKCPIQQTYYKLNKSESAVEKAMSKKLNRREIFYVLVQIVDDQIDPSLNGKIKVFKFGKKLKAKIDAQRNPTYGDKVQMFHLFEGKNFHLRLTRQGDFNDYDQCEFLKEVEPISINGIKMTKSKADLGIIREYLSEAPVLGNFEYKAWTEEEEAEVMSILRTMKSPGKNYSQVTNRNAAPESIEKIVAKVDFSNDKDSKHSESKHSESKHSESKNSESKQVKDDTSGDADLENFLENLENELTK
jgi:hypothetical protein